MLRDLDLKFLNEFVYACPTDGYCDPIPGIERTVEDWQKLKVTKDGDIRNCWRLPIGTKSKTSIEYHHCIKCLHPVGQWEARKVNDYFGYKAPSIADILEGLPEL